MVLLHFPILSVNVIMSYLSEVPIVCAKSSSNDMLLI